MTHDDGNNYQRHKKPWEQGLKERSKSNFFKQGIQQNYVIKKQEHRTKNKNMRCAKQTWKWIFIMLTYVNMNIKKTW
jgi:hypothetical protein